MWRTPLHNDTMFKSHEVSTKNPTRETQNKEKISGNKGFKDRATGAREGGDQGKKEWKSLGWW